MENQQRDSVIANVRQPGLEKRRLNQTIAFADYTGKNSFAVVLDRFVRPKNADDRMAAFYCPPLMATLFLEEFSRLRSGLAIKNCPSRLLKRVGSYCEHGGFLFDRRRTLTFTSNVDLSLSRGFALPAEAVILDVFCGTLLFDLGPLHPTSSESQRNFGTLRLARTEWRLDPPG